MSRKPFKTPYKDLLPGLSKAEFDALKADIKANGVRVSVDVDDENNVLDGHNRLVIDPNAPVNVIKGLSPAEKEAYVLRSNSVRRNLSPEQEWEVNIRKKETAFKLREEDAKKWTQAKVAAALGVGRQTVSDWFNVSNAGSGKANHADRPDARLSLPKDRREEVVYRVDSGETHAKVADDIKISRSRVTQIVVAARNKEKKKAEIDAISLNKVAATFGKLYGVMVIDPPWPMEKIDREVSPNQVEFDYPTMTEEELAKFDFPASADCHAWVWTTHRFLPMAFRLIEVWGLKYVCTFVWHKPGGFQPFGLPQYNCEFAIYCRRGSPSFTTTKALPTCFNAPRGKHSEKPEEFYEMVRRVTKGDRIDIFNRREIKGFDCWGNEA